MLKPHKKKPDIAPSTHARFTNGTTKPVYINVDSKYSIEDMRNEIKTYVELTKAALIMPKALHFIIVFIKSNEDSLINIIGNYIRA